MNAHPTGDTAASNLQAGARVALFGMIVNLVFAAAKILGGLVGNAYVLIADGIESALDIAGSLIIWGGLKFAARPPDETHPYGHGKAEPIAAVVVAVGVLALTACSPGAQADPLKPPLTDVGNIQLPKEAGKPAFDLLTLDPRNGHLYVSHSSVETLEVVDVRTRTLIGRVVDKVGARAVILTGLPLLALTTWQMGALDLTTSDTTIRWWLAARG